MFAVLFLSCSGNEPSTRFITKPPTNQPSEPLLLCIHSRGRVQKTATGSGSESRRTNTHAACHCLPVTRQINIYHVGEEPISVMQFDDTLIIVSGGDADGVSWLQTMEGREAGRFRAPGSTTRCRRGIELEIGWKKQVVAKGQVTWKWLSELKSKVPFYLTYQTTLKLSWIWGIFQKNSRLGQRKIYKGCWSFQTTLD